MSESTRWTVIRDAAKGDAVAREEFARRYQPVIRAYLSARWRNGAARDSMEDAVQEVFLDCFREHGALERADPEAGDFRGFLYGIVRNVARRFEERRAVRREQQPPSDFFGAIEDPETPLSEAFDRAWARALLAEAWEILALRARAAGDAAARRLELLRMRFQEDMPIRDIAEAWQADPAHLHHEYARARDEFKAALKEVVGRYHAGGPDVVAAECVRLLDCLRK